MLSRHPSAATLRAHVSIAAFIGETVRLKAAGEGLRGRCTAHPDRERALFVDDAKGLYRCFACGRQGDVVQWARETGRCGEDEAIEMLRRRSGIRFDDA